MTLVTPTYILLVTSSYVTMPNMKRCVEMSLDPGREKELGTLVSINNISPTFTCNVLFTKN